MTIQGPPTSTAIDPIFTDTNIYLEETFVFRGKTDLAEGFVLQPFNTAVQTGDGAADSRRIRA